MKRTDRTLLQPADQITKYRCKLVLVPANWQTDAEEKN
jgi:hypothetical protein